MDTEKQPSICGGCGEIHPVCYCDMRPTDEELVSNCCTAPFDYPGWPDSDICSACFEHAELITEKEK